MPEPTMRDLYKLLQNCASKEDMDTIKSQIVASNAETVAKVDDVARRVDNIDDTQNQHAEKIKSLEINLEVLKQEQLKNNVCISGVPPSMLKENNNTSQIVTSIAKSLNVEFNASQFSSYAVARNKFIIVSFYNLKYKQMLLNKIRVKKSLMVEEVFHDVQSNSQIYLNDHLTPYFNNLYLIARNAKKEGKLASASSYGGKIRARKTANDTPTVIMSESQLHSLIDMDVSDMSFDSSHQTINVSNASSSVAIVSPTPPSIKKQPKKQHKKQNAVKTIATGASTSGNSSGGSNSTNNRHSNKNSNNNNASAKSNRHQRNSNVGNGKRPLDDSGSSNETEKKTKVPPHSRK